VTELVFGIEIAGHFDSWHQAATGVGTHNKVARPIPKHFGESQTDRVAHLEMLARVVGRVVAQPLTPGNRLQPLVNGDEAFPAMLSAIESSLPDQPLITALNLAALRGVRVDILLPEKNNLLYLH